MQRTTWLIVAGVLVSATLYVGYRLHAGQWSSIWAVVLGLAVIVTLVVVSRTYEEFLNYFVFALCGGALGWVIGILASPSTAEEERIFGDYKTAIMAFVSGFAVTKLNDLWKILTDDKENAPRILQAPVLNRALLFFGMFFLLVAQQYNTRQSNAGAVIVSASVSPDSALAGQTKATVTVRPGALITLRGAAEAPNMDVDWKVGQDSPFSKVATLAKTTLPVATTQADAKMSAPDTTGIDVFTIKVPDAASLASSNVQDGDSIHAIATSRWNHAKTATLDIVVRMEKAAAPTATPSNDTPK